MAFRPSNQAQVLAFRRWGDSPAASVEVVHAAPEEVQEPVDVDALIAEAFERGRAEGRAAVEEEVAEERASLEGVQEALIAVAEEIEGLRHATLAQSADDVAQLVLLFARRVVDRSLALHPEALPALVMEAVQQNGLTTEDMRGHRGGPVRRTRIGTCIGRHARKRGGGHGGGPAKWRRH